MPSNAPKDTLTDLTSKAYENSTENKQGKISSTPATYSTDLTGNGESNGVEGNFIEGLRIVRIMGSDANLTVK